MKHQLIECVPNFSEGRDMSVIKQITGEIERVDGVKLIDVDPGSTTNRTVVTLVGDPASVCEAAFRAVRKASELIDMRRHTGAHPRFGAADVCPLVPVANITMEETAAYAQDLARRIGSELGIPVYCYESAAKDPKRRNLAECRSGEYEGLSSKLADPQWKPDYGPGTFTAQAEKTGACAVGARNFLVAVNFNLNTTSVRRANSVAFDVREKGRVKRQGDPITGEIVRDADGNTVWELGTLAGTKAIGWFIGEFGIAQVSMNITDIAVTPVHVAFDEVCDKAAARGLRVTGCEIVGVIPLSVLTDAGKYYLAKQRRSAGVSESELIKIAVKSMGLDDLAPFDPEKKVIEYLIRDTKQSRLAEMTLAGFADSTASESPAPGGGSAAAYLGALGVSLGTMVANLSAHKRGWDDRWEEFSKYAEAGMRIQQELLRLVDADTRAFHGVMDAHALPKRTREDKLAREKALQQAVREAIEVPLTVMKLSYESMEIMEAMVEKGNPNSVSDAAVGALAARCAVRGAYLNVQINARDLADSEYAKQVLLEGSRMVQESGRIEREILELAEKKIG